MGEPESHDGADSPPPSDQRSGARYLACFPAHLSRDDGTTRVSMIRDLSATGALLLVRGEAKVGDPVRLKLFIHGDVDRAREATARIVRIEPLEDPFVGLWSQRIAVHFDEPLSDVLPEIATLAQHQAEILR